MRMDTISRDVEVRHQIVWRLLGQHVIDVTCGQSARKVNVLRQDLDLNGRGSRTKDYRNLHGARSWAIQIVRISSLSFAVQS